MSATRFVISGAVQGVGFRYFTVRAARRAGLKGWVRNLPDGNVEVLAEGPAGALDGLRRELRIGPAGARVTGVEESPADEGSPSGEFSVRF